ncbi:hypothetical protein [Rhodanobacter sp. OR87]|uniref:hypothetical protein n=1 Tax=Rhodanobacter sp. OR87 TaxID=1076523 RepID=UPI0004822254|nr:hypothetical protein [Rhodanobacter sp. OR87]
MHRAGPADAWQMRRVAMRDAWSVFLLAGTGAIGLPAGNGGRSGILGVVVAGHRDLENIRLIP